jgi:hypothetical protein
MRFFFFAFILFVACGTKNKQTDKSVNTEKVLQRKLKIISDSTNKLIDKVEKLELEYIVWGCDCPNWITVADRKKYSDSLTSKRCLFIEPSTDNLILPIYFDPFRHRLKVVGQFYAKEDYPKGTIETEEHLEKAKVFRYTDFDVIDNPDFKPKSKVQTLTLTYDAIACTCAQWSESKFDNSSDKKVRYWLESSNQNLPSADTLYNGNNLPVHIKVTGQVVSESGFPKRKNLSKVGQDEAGKVFRYTKIEVLKIGRKKNGY